MIKNTIYTLDWKKVKPEVLKNIKSGGAAIYNGVARDKNNFQILQHMPFIPTKVENVQNLSTIADSISKYQQIAVAAQAVSTACIMGAIVLQTMYLTSKLNELNRAIEGVMKKVSNQNIIYFTDKLSYYFACIDSLWKQITNKRLVAENHDYIYYSLNQASQNRDYLLTFNQQLIPLIDGFDESDKSTTINFINNSLSLLPKGIFIESQAAFTLEKFVLGEHILNIGKDNYNRVIDDYKNWGNEQFNLIVSGKHTSDASLLKDNIDDIKFLVKSEENRYLLEHTS